ncbi:MAG TPA: acyl-CoA dehydrogenase [Deltaproteobacteria bacterium]|nr:acyl-CoA dehydrogenase [Deltaproteobacteria bacterium]
MDLDLAPEDAVFRDKLRAWLKQNLPQAARRRSVSEGEAPGARLAAMKAWQRKLHAAGYVAMGWPREYGGQGATLMQQTLLSEELVRHKAPGLVGMMGLQMVGPTLIHWGTEAQKRRYLPPILTADELWCQGYSEPGSGSDLASLKTSALREGDHFVVNGQKIWTSNAQIADWMFCLVRTDKAAPKHAGISYLLIDMKTPGIMIRPLLQMTKDAGFNEVFFDNVRVPVENVVGGLGQGWAVANTTLLHERNMLGSTTQTQNIFEALLRVARTTLRDGRPATEHPVVRQRLAALKIQVEAMRLNAYRNLTATLQGKKPGIEASITKLVTCELNHQLAATALDLLGPYGTLYRGSKHLRDDGFWPYELMFSLGLIIGGGTAQIQKNIIAQRGLGLPRFK